MCKFNNRLFVFALNCLIGLVGVLAKPLQDSPLNSAGDLGALVALSALMNPQDVHYDQRQKGEENYRIKLDGFFIGLPQEDSTALLLFTDDMFESIDDDNLLAFGKNKHAARVSASPPSLPVTLSTSPILPASSESNQQLSPNVDITANNVTPVILEIPSSKNYLEARQSLDSVSKTKSYITHFLNLLKRGRKH